MHESLLATSLNVPTSHATAPPPATVAPAEASSSVPLDDTSIRAGSARHGPPVRRGW